MMTPEDRALAQVERITDAKLLRRMVANARGQSDAVANAALRRLVSLSTAHEAGTVEYDCWSMIHTIEELRRLEGRSWRMNHLRKKITKDGEIEALRYCAARKTDGFEEVLSLGLPDMTAEAIVQRHPNVFGVDIREAAHTRLAAALNGGQEPDIAAESALA